MTPVRFTVPLGSRAKAGQIESLPDVVAAWFVEAGLAVRFDDTAPLDPREKPWANDRLRIPDEAR